MMPSLNRIFTGKRGDALAKGLLRLYRSEEDPAPVGDLLFHLLQQFRHMSRRTIQHITDALLRENITVKQHMGMHALLDGPNGEIFQTYVTRQFFAAAAEERDDFVYAGASIKITTLTGTPHDAVENAVTMILRESHPALVAQSLAVIALHCRTRAEQLSTLRTGLKLRKDKALWEKIMTWLRQPDGLHYRLACDAVEVAFLLYGFDPQMLCDKALIRAACHAWQSGTNPRPARKLLGLLPLGPDRIPSPDRGTMGRRSLGQYRRRSAAGYYPGIVLQFRLCANLGCWNNREFRDQYRQLVILLGRSKDLVTAMDTCHMQLLRYEVQHLLAGTNPFRETPPVYLLNDLPRSAKARLNAMVAEVRADPEKTYTLNTAGEALEILEFIRCAYQDDPSCSGDAPLLLPRCRIAAQDIGSCVIADWFEMLCCFGCTEQALDFYRAYPEVLNRPWCYIDGLLLDSDWTSLKTYGKFAQNQTRLSRALGLALHLNHLDLVRAFSDVSQEAGLELTPMVQYLLDETADDMDDTADFLLAKTRGSWITDLMTPSTPGRLMGLWNRHYDDRGLTALALKYCPIYHNLVLKLGYCDDEQMALTAVRARGSSLLFVSGWMTRRDSVCTAALEQDCSIIHLIQAPMIEDRALVKKILGNRDLSLRKAPKWLRDDRDYVLERMKQEPRDLHWASERLRNDREVVAQAVAGCPDALALASDRLRRDPVLRRLARQDADPLPPQEDDYWLFQDLLDE